MNNLKKLLRELSKQKKSLVTRKIFVLDYDAIELEFINDGPEWQAIYKEAELKAVNGLLQRIDSLSKEANGLIAEVDNYEKKPMAAKGVAAANEISKVSSYLRRMQDLIGRINKLSGDCDALVHKLPEELAIGTY